MSAWGLFLHLLAVAGGVFCIGSAILALLLFWFWLMGTPKRVT